jgi:transposase
MKQPDDREDFGEAPRKSRESERKGVHGIAEVELVMSQGGDTPRSLRYAGVMRYPQGGGLTAERQRFREELRLHAAERFGRDEPNAVIARELRVSVRSVQRWRRAWSEGGSRALRSAGPPSVPRLSEEQVLVLERELAKGPAAHGWGDQRWTMARVKTVIGRRFHLTYTIQGVRMLLVRNGWSCQVPARRRWSATTMRSRGGSRRCGPARKPRGGAWSLPRLRGRSRVLHDARG